MEGTLGQLLGNKIQFYKRLMFNSKMAVRNLFNSVKDDLRTTTGNNCRLLKNICVDLEILNQDQCISEVDIKEFYRKYKFAMIPDGEDYKISVLHDLLSLRHQFSFFEEEQLTQDDITCMINDICSA